MDIRVPASGSQGNCHVVSDGTTEILIDPGIPFAEIRRALAFRVSDLAGSLVSHSHADHARAAKDVLKTGIDLYASKETVEALGLAGHRLHVIEPMRKFKIGTWAILPFDTPHDVENLGFLLVSQAGEHVLYLADTPYCKYKFAALNYILIGCNYDLPLLKANVKAGLVDRELKRRVLHNHMSLDRLKAFLKANDLSRVKEIWLLHLSDGNSDAEMFKRTIRQLTGKPTYIG